jgi:hypothetical protein
VFNQFPSAGIAGYSEIAGSVFAASRTNRIDEYLKPFVEQAILTSVVREIGSPSPVSVMNLIESLKDKKIACVYKTFGNLRPHLLYLVLNLEILGHVGSGGFEVEPVAITARTIVVDVDDDIEAGFFSIAYDFCHALETAVNLIVGSRTYVT